MKENKIQDERILSERRKIQSRGFAWLVTILIISTFVQQFIMQAPFAQYAVEYFLMLGCGLYNIIANYKKGIDIWDTNDNGKTKIFITTLIAGVISVIVFVFLSEKLQINYLIVYFVTFFVILFVVRLIMLHLNNKRQQALDEELNDDSND